MNITKQAATEILRVMSEVDLDIQKFAASFEFVNGGVGFSFTKDTFGKEYKFHGLRVIVDERIETEDMIIDFSEVDGRKGLIFKGEEDGSNTERKSSQGSQASS